MAETLKVGLELDAKEAEAAIKRLTAESKTLNKELKTVKGALAQATGTPKTATGSGASGAGGDREAYRVTRAGMGTGAAGRDFAKQAQGLGGLVHVYATFAANIFAVTAAYQALSKAFEVERLEKSAEIMSGKLGISINNLGKDLQKTTGYAISMGEALQFSAMGISAGISEKQLKSLVQIAKGAANALGRDVNDSTRRIIQGTAKQEQEILDELGIFVKAKKAYEEYAKARGIAVNDLSPTQKVQAFADAVERGGRHWKEFSEIDDPFSKFTATAKQAGAGLLSAVNTFIGPILNFLSQSEGMVKVILLTITAQLAKMAIPHLGQQLRAAFSVDPAEITRYEEARLKVTKNYTEQINKERAEQARISKSLYAMLPYAERGGIKKLGAEDLSEAKAIARASILHKISIGTLSIEEATNQKLIYKVKKSGEIIPTKTAERNLAAQILALKQQELVLINSIANAESTRSTRAEEAHSSQARRFFIFDAEKSAKNRAAVSTRSADITQNLGTSSIPLFAKLFGNKEEDIKGLFQNLIGMIKDADGWVGKIANTFRMLGVAGALAMQGIFAAMGPLILIFSVWQIAIKPLLYYFGVFTKEADALKETTTRLTDSSKALTQGWVSAKEGMNAYGLSIKELDSYYNKLSTSALSAKDAILEQQQALKALQAIKPGAVASKEDMTAVQGVITGALNSGLVDKESQSYKDLLTANVQLQLAKITGIDVEKRYAEAVRLSTTALSNQDLETQKLSKGINDVSNSLDVAEKAIKALLERKKDKLDPNLPKLVHTETQAAYKAFRIGFEDIVKMTDNGSISSGLNAMLASFGNITESLPDATARILKMGDAVAWLYAAVLSKNPAEIAKRFKVVNDLSMETQVELGKGISTGKPKKEPVAKMSTLDYAILVNKQQSETLEAQGRRKASSENFQAQHKKDLELIDLEYEKRLGVWEADKGHRDDVAKAQQLEYLMEKRLSSIEEAKLNTAKKEYDFKIKGLQDAVGYAEKLIDKNGTFYEKEGQLNDLYRARLKLLEEIENLPPGVREKERRDLREKERKDKLDLKMGISFQDVVSGDIPINKDRTNRSDILNPRFEYVTETATEAARESARIAKANQTGALEGTFQAFDKGLDSSMTTLFDAIQSGAEVTSSAIGTAFRNAASDVFRDLAIQQAKLAIKQGTSAVMSFLFPAAAATPSANGNIMTSNGAMKLNKYASGGIAHSPQLSLFGEGRQPEAYVPLPDGRSIPVTMKGSSSDGSPITIQVNVNTTSGSTETKASGGGDGGVDAMAALGNMISQKVKEVIINESRPNGLLASRG